MKRILYFFLGLMTLQATIQAQAPSKKAPSTESDNALLWEVSGNGLEKPSYIFGTIHLIGADDFFWPNGTQQAIQRSERVVFEIDMEEMNDPAALFTLFNSATMSDGITLNQLMSEADYALVSKEFESKGLPMMMLNRIKPMFLTVMVGEEFSGESLMSGFGDDIKSYEMEIMEIAKQQNKPTAGLETIDFQISIFDSIPYKDQADMLVDAIKSGQEPDSGLDQLSLMVELYKKQDLTAISKMMQEEDETLMKYGELLLDGRNKTWIPHMEKMMNTESNFFAVGAGHLAGKMGVISLLRKAGYTVTPLSHS